MLQRYRQNQKLITALAELSLVVMISCSITFINAYQLPEQIRLRSGFPDDDLAISITMARKLMNPNKGISHKNNLIVAEHMPTGERVGWAHIRSLGYAGVSTYPSQFEDGDDDYALRKDAQSTMKIEDDVDEIMWQEFEDDPVDFPNGLASLPWTKEYRAASQAATDRLKRRERMMEVELANRPKLWELSSVYVLKEWRHKGIGSAIVDQVLKQHVTKKQRGNDIYALIPASSVHWYEQFGFTVEDQVPNVMASKLNVGKALTRVMGKDDLVCIHTTKGT